MRAGRIALSVLLGMLHAMPSGAAGEPARGEPAAIPRLSRAAELFSRNCQGCHGHTGVSVSEVPRLRGQVGWFLHTPEGRDYVVRVPGVAFAPLSDRDLTETLNWMLAAFSADELPPGWQPYTVAEVARLRRRPVPNITRERAVIVDELVRLGVVPDAERVSFSSGPDY